MLTIQPIPAIPLIQPGDELAKIISEKIQAAGIRPENGDILVIAQKIVSKAEGRLFNLAEIVPSEAAVRLAAETEKDPRFLELVLRESSEVLRTRPGTIIVEHRLGFVCANAGIDHSNVLGPDGSPEDWVLLLPEAPDASAERIRQQCESIFQASLGVMIIDSHGRAWRNGTVGAAIGLANIPGIVDMRGEPDLFGYRLRVTMVAAADELAAAASLMMGQAAEGTPVVHVRGFPYDLREAQTAELLRSKQLDMFR